MLISPKLSPVYSKIFLVSCWNTLVDRNLRFPLLWQPVLAVSFYIELSSLNHLYAVRLCALGLTFYHVSAACWFNGNHSNISFIVCIDITLTYTLQSSALISAKLHNQAWSVGASKLPTKCTLTNSASFQPLSKNTETAKSVLKPVYKLFK